MHQVMGNVTLSLMHQIMGQYHGNDALMHGELKSRVLDLRPKGPGFEPHRRHWVVVLEQDTFILA